MIEVITYADITLRLATEDDYEAYIKDQLNGLDPHINVEQILSMSKPYKNEDNWSIEVNLLAEFILNIPEKETNQRVQDYVDEIIPFLKRHIPKCNDILSTKIVQLKRVIQ